MRCNVWPFNTPSENTLSYRRSQYSTLLCNGNCTPFMKTKLLMRSPLVERYCSSSDAYAVTLFNREVCNSTTPTLSCCGVIAACSCKECDLTLWSKVANVIISHTHTGYGNSMRQLLYCLCLSVKMFCECYSLHEYLCF